MRNRLRLYTGEVQNVATLPAEEMTVKLGDICQILADAVRTKRAWVSDFADEEIQISPDLYEVLSAYWRMRPSA
ncbi:MAG: hypothetical protein HZA46_01585 [Planctomycetales bacterium]|nr:hypothetical protein [Planctomycetales bacterium]